MLCASSWLWGCNRHVNVTGSEKYYVASQPQKWSVYLATRHGNTSNCACGKSDHCRVNVFYTHPYIPSQFLYFHGKQYKCILYSELVIYVFRERMESLVRPRKFLCRITFQEISVWLLHLLHIYGFKNIVADQLTVVSLGRGCSGKNSFGPLLSWQIPLLTLDNAILCREESHHYKILLLV